MLHDKVTITMTNPTGLEVFTGVGKIDSARAQGVRIKKMKMAVTKAVSTADDFAVLFGLAPGGMSGTEIQAALAADPSGINDADQMELTNRKVFPIGVFPRGPASSDRMHALRETHFPWKELDEGTGMTFWSQNWENAVQTGDPVIEFTVAYVLEWLRD